MPCVGSTFILQTKGLRSWSSERTSRAVSTARSGDAQPAAANAIRVRPGEAYAGRRSWRSIVITRWSGRRTRLLRRLPRRTASRCSPAVRCMAGVAWPHRSQTRCITGAPCSVRRSRYVCWWVQKLGRSCEIRSIRFMAFPNCVKRIATVYPATFLPVQGAPKPQEISLGAPKSHPRGCLMTASVYETRGTARTFRDVSAAAARSRNERESIRMGSVLAEEHGKD